MVSPIRELKSFPLADFRGNAGVTGGTLHQCNLHHLEMLNGVG